MVYYKYLRARTRKYKMNTSIINTGDTGSGKTIRALIEATIINRNFDETKYANTAKEFLNVVDDSKKSDVVVWDEAGVSLSSRKWHSLSNIMTGEVLQTYRDRYLTVIFIAPDLSFVDVQARRLLNIFTETKRYDQTKSLGYLYKISINRKKGEIFFPWYQIRSMGTLINMPRINIPRESIKKISPSVLKAIKEKETEFKAKIRKNSLKMIQIIESEEENTDTIYDMINKVVSNQDKFMNIKGSIDQSLIQLEFGIGRTKADQIVKFVKKELAKV